MCTCMCTDMCTCMYMCTCMCTCMPTHLHIMYVNLLVSVERRFIVDTSDVCVLFGGRLLIESLFAGIPAALMQSGFSVGVVLLVVMAIITDYTVILLIRNGLLVNKFTYQVPPPPTHTHTHTHTTPHTHTHTLI